MKVVHLISILVLIPSFIAVDSIFYSSSYFIDFKDKPIFNRTAPISASFTKHNKLHKRYKSTLVPTSFSVNLQCIDTKNCELVKTLVSKAVIRYTKTLLIQNTINIGVTFDHFCVPACTDVLGRASPTSFHVFTADVALKLGLYPNYSYPGK